MIVVKNIAGSFIGTLIAVWFCRWLGWIPSYGCVAEQYFVEHYKEIAIGLLTVGWMLGIIYALLLVAYALYRMAKTIE